MDPDDVQDRLAEFRRDLYGGRGPGIPDEERLRRTSLRPEIAGLPTAALREEVHLRTLRARGERVRADLQGAWAAVQFPTRDGGIAAPDLVPTLRDERPRHGRRLLAGLVLGGLALLKARRRVRSS
jgi:hypothetical protein